MKRNKLSVLLFILVISTLSAMETERMEGIIYQKDTMDVIYTQKEIVSEYNNTRKIEHLYFRTDGSQAASEAVLIEDGKIMYYETLLDDLGVKGTIRRDDNKMIISYEEDGRVKERSLKWKDELIAGPMLGEFISDHRDRLLEGESITFLLPFFDRQVLIPFKLEMKNDRESRYEDNLVVEMKLKNFFFGMLVDPIDFVLEGSEGVIRAIHGPTILPDPADSNKNNMLFADIFYTYSGESE